ncbi:PLP-dependent aminotransferase family protein [Paenibacillus lentus]|uniref:aminotransferase-like domain-containing protein n=1 Tax=Paenibacillus lentus TaxID=1338368 RepID=UPI0013DE2E05|nr:PLP-dependent aminotransferase family protein [Paenibacillus lentus]
MERWLDLAQRKQLLPLGQKFNKLSDAAEMISLALCGGDGGEGVEGLSAALRQARSKLEIPGTLNEYEPQGSRALRNWLSTAYMKEEGSRVDPMELLLTGGSAEAIDFILRWRIRTGGTVLLETPASPEVLELIRQQGGRAVLIPCDKDGMRIDSLEQQIAKNQPVLVYITPSYSNPSGRVWSEQRKRALLQLGSGYSLLIVEDDSAGVIPFRTYSNRREGHLTLYQLQQEGGALYAGADVLGIGSFQATAFPSLPVAWIRGSKRVIEALTKVRLALAGRGKASVQEKAAYEKRLYALLSAPEFSWPAHAERLEAEYAARRTAMLELLREQAPWQGTSYEEPQGGLFLWLRLPPGLCSEALLRAALPKGAAFMPGARCYAAGGAEPDGDAIRLTFAAHRAARLRQGLARIAEAIAEFTARGAG